MSFGDKLRSTHKRYLADKNKPGWTIQNLTNHLEQFCNTSEHTAKAIARLARLEGELWDKIEVVSRMNIGRSKDKPLLGSQYPFNETSGVPDAVQIRLLDAVINSAAPNMSLFQRGCKRYRAMTRLRTALVSYTKCSSWKKMKKKFPTLATKEFQDSQLSYVMKMGKKADFSATFVQTVRDHMDLAKKKKGACKKSS